LGREKACDGEWALTSIFESPLNGVGSESDELNLERRDRRFDCDWG
jgi:hypothetical protein